MPWYSSWGTMPNATEVKLLHVDARLRDGIGNFVYSGYRDIIKNVTNSLDIATNNTSSSSKSGFDEISMISSKTEEGTYLTSYTGLDSR